MITIDITQTCDGCAIYRMLNSANAAENGGWREVQPNKHLCPECIKKALGGE